MLSELHIQNFAIIHELALALDDGLVIFTGETGAGKSIILDALEAVLGGRVDATSIRTGEERAIVEATFKLKAGVKEKVTALLEAEALLDEPDYVTLTREIRLEGRNIARINGRSVSVALQREVGALLVDIHGQSEHLSLLKVRNHLDLLDQYADTAPELTDYRESYTEYRNQQKELEELRQLERDAARRTDMLTYQINEIEAARLQPDEEGALRQERTRLSNVENLSSLSQQALMLLDEGTPEAAPITDLLGEVVNALADLERIDGSVAPLYERADAGLSSLSDLSHDLRHYAEGIEFNPRRLDQIEERIDLINRLKRKFGNSIDEVLSFLERTRVELDNINHVEERIGDLDTYLSELTEVITKKGLLLSDKRRKAALVLAAEVEAQLNDLSMLNARFAVDLSLKLQPRGVKMPDGSHVAFDASGFDQAEFLVEPNPGEGLKPLVKIASGGETSRLMLALKNVLASADAIPVLVFDEIDQGIGGRVGLTVGEKLWQLAHQHQVMCVTHLPQLAAYGDQHFHVNKVVEDGRTQTVVEELSAETRQKELAQMMGPVSDGTLQSAREILALIAQSKGKIS
jgi:DNA repair protein RecN (Recombination protein N)